MPYVKIFINDEIANNLLNKEKRDKAIDLLVKGLKEELSNYDYIKDVNHKKVLISNHNTTNEYRYYKNRGNFKVVIKDYTDGRPDYVKISPEDVKKLNGLGSSWNRMIDSEKDEWLSKNFNILEIHAFLRYMFQKLDEYEIMNLLKDDFI